VIAVLVVTTSVSVVPGGEGQPLIADQGTSTVEASLVSADDRIGIIGTIRLSPQVRFTVSASEQERWRVGAYDRYTGTGWVRTGSAVPYQGTLQRPPGQSRRVVQTMTVEGRMSTMPAAWKPIRVGGDTNVMVSDLGGLQPTQSFATGDEYTVESAVPLTSPAQLRRTGTDYPDAIHERYTQVPESTPQRVADLTEQVTAEATNPYDTAVAIERYLESEKQYSLDVNRPDGDIADAFLFEMEAGYCTYYATTMVTMLRSQGIPARFVVGYLPGQEVASNEWVVRGFDSHAWVEVYFPRTGWVAFDPTPAGPRQEAEQARLTQARANEEPNVDTGDSNEGSDTTDGADLTVAVTEFTESENASDSALNPAEGEIARTPIGVADSAASTNDAGGGGLGIGVPTREEAAYGLVLLAGVLVAGQRLGVVDRLYRRYWLRRPVSGSPPERIEQTVSRLEYVLGKRYRPRHPDETPREYRETLRNYGASAEILRLYELYEAAHYRGAASDEEAAEAGRLYRDVVADVSLSTRVRAIKPWS
ncbi:MAG: transglutaminaseTgpA domain-containing protein, partial [Halobacteriales archaeon]|nr:transglutaminaseTgpA domain-containing protein [Halobacteriales archaeon]